jgi:hypothetical protein
MIPRPAEMIPARPGIISRHREMIVAHHETIPVCAGMKSRCA